MCRVQSNYNAIECNWIIGCNWITAWNSEEAKEMFIFVFHVCTRFVRIFPFSFIRHSILRLYFSTMLFNYTAQSYFFLPLTRWLPRVFPKKSPPGHACSSTKRSLLGAPSRSCGGLKNDLPFRLFATLKPLAVVEYNEGKCGIDYSDQMVSYATAIRKGIKWYGKLGTQLLLGISVVNALTAYKIATRKNINIRIFRQLLVAKLLGLFENTKNPSLRRSRHNIVVRKNDSGRSIRRACKPCYANKRRRVDRAKTQKNLKKTTTYCPNCPDQPQLCIECFKVLHSK